MMLIFTGIFLFFLHYKKKKRQQCRFDRWKRKKGGKEEKVTLAAKCPGFKRNQINGYLAVKNKGEGMLP